MVAYLRRVLRVKETDSVFLYVNSSFAPALDEVVGNLHRVSGLSWNPWDERGGWMGLGKGKGGEG